MHVRHSEDVADLRSSMAAYNRAWRVGYRGIVPADVIEAALRPTDDETLETLENEIPSHAGRFYVVEHEGTVVGFIRARYGNTGEHVDPHGAEILDLVVDPAMWRKGFGSALLERTVEWLPSMLDDLYVAVLPGNERARSFLETHEFEEDGTIDADVGGESLEHDLYRLDLKE